MALNSGRRLGGFGGHDTKSLNVLSRQTAENENCKPHRLFAETWTGGHCQGGRGDTRGAHCKAEEGRRVLDRTTPEWGCVCSDVTGTTCKL